MAAKAEPDTKVTYTSEILSSMGTNTFIPVLRQGDWTNAVPTALGGVYGVDLSTDSIEKYRELFGIFMASTTFA